MRTVWKYQLEWTDQAQPIWIPYKSGVLLGPHIAVQAGKICLWAEVETDKDPMKYVFHVRGTGHEVPETHDSAAVDYLGSVLMDNGLYVWHVFVSQ